MRSITKRELAAALPNNRGGRGRHIVTVDRMVRRGDLPAYDFKFSDGVAGWTGETAARDPRIGAFVAFIATEPNAA